MRSYSWFAFGVMVSFFVIVSLGACSFDTSGTGDGSTSTEPVDPIQGSVAHRDMDEGFVRPAVPLTPQKSAGLTLELVPPVESLVVGIAGSDVLLASYLVHNDDDVPHTLSRFTVHVGGARAVETVAYTWDAASVRADVGLPSADDSVTFKTYGEFISAHAIRRIEIRATLKLIPPDPSESPRSGETVFADLISAQDEDGTDIALTSLPETRRVILRKNVPTVESDPVIGSLHVGWQDVSRWRVGTSITGDVALKQFVFDVRVDAATLCSLRLRRNGKLVNAADYHITAFSADMAAPIDAKTACFTTGMRVAITFDDEERITVGSQPEYALRADVTHIDTFAGVRVRLFDRHQLATSSLNCSSDLIDSLRSNPSDPPAVLWSDLSEQPHRFTSCFSSKDWIGDALLSDLSWTTTLG
jgi:hypothetical protein